MLLFSQFENLRCNGWELSSDVWFTPQKTDSRAIAFGNGGAARIKDTPVEHGRPVLSREESLDAANAWGMEDKTKKDAPLDCSQATTATVTSSFSSFWGSSSKQVWMEKGETEVGTSTRNKSLHPKESKRTDRMSLRRKITKASVKYDELLADETSIRSSDFDDNLDTAFESLMLSNRQPERVQRHASSGESSEDLALDQTLRKTSLSSSSRELRTRHEDVACWSLDGKEGRGQASRKKRKKRPRIPRPPKGFAAQLQIPNDLINERPRRLRVQCIAVSIPAKTSSQTDSTHCVVPVLETTRKQGVLLAGGGSSRSLDDLDVQYSQVSLTNSTA
jgi:hypothetical protein